LARSVLLNNKSATIEALEYAQRGARSTSFESILALHPIVTIRHLPAAAI
jgi:hypothetical protein